MLTLKTTATVTKINRKSSSPCFKDLKVGDMIEFSVPIKRAGSNRGQTYSTYILCHNRRTNAESELSFNQIEKVLECCELVEGDNVLTDDEIYIVCPDYEKLIHLKPNKAELECAIKVGCYTFDKEKENAKD